MTINNMTMIAIIAEKMGQPEKMESGVLPVSWSYTPKDAIQRIGWQKALDNTFSTLENYSTAEFTPYQLCSLYNGWIMQLKYFDLNKVNEPYIIPFYLTCLDVVHILNEIFKDGPRYMNMDYMNEKMEELHKKITKKK